ncbi:DNA-binding protein [Rhizobium sp. PAMB 3182]
MTKVKQQQIDKFREAARQLETDDDEARFDQRLGKIAKSPPPKEDGTKDKKPAK